MKWIGFAAIGVALVLAGCAAPAKSTDADRGALLALHQTVTEAHLAGDVEAWLAVESADYISANHGETTFPDKPLRREQRAPYLEATTFVHYTDLVDPIVRISDDGTLGWVIVQVGVEGLQRQPDGTQSPLEFVAAWIELYEKRDGKWVMTGNVSNLKN